MLCWFGHVLVVVLFFFFFVSDQLKTEKLSACLFDSMTLICPVFTVKLYCKAGVASDHTEENALLVWARRESTLFCSIVKQPSSGVYILLQASEAWCEQGHKTVRRVP